MTYNVFSGTLNPTHSLTHSPYMGCVSVCLSVCNVGVLWPLNANVAVLRWFTTDDNYLC